MIFQQKIMYIACIIIIISYPYQCAKVQKCPRLFWLNTCRGRKKAIKFKQKRQKRAIKNHIFSWMFKSHVSLPSREGSNDAIISLTCEISIGMINIRRHYSKVSFPFVLLLYFFRLKFCFIIITDLRWNFGPHYYFNIRTLFCHNGISVGEIARAIKFLC